MDINLFTQLNEKDLFASPSDKDLENRELTKPPREFTGVIITEISSEKGTDWHGNPAIEFRYNYEYGNSNTTVSVISLKCAKELRDQLNRLLGS